MAKFQIRIVLFVIFEFFYWPSLKLFKKSKFSVSQILWSKTKIEHDVGLLRFLNLMILSRIKFNEFSEEFNCFLIKTFYIEWHRDALSETLWFRDALLERENVWLPGQREIYGFKFCWASTLKSRRETFSRIIFNSQRPLLQPDSILQDARECIFSIWEAKKN